MSASEDSPVSRGVLQAVKSTLPIHDDSSKPPLGLRWRSNTLFILATVAVGLFTDLFLYGLVVPILPFMLQQRIHLQPGQIQSHIDGLLAAYAGASMLFSPVAGWIADRTSSRQLPFLAGLFALLLATILLDVAANLTLLVIARVLQGISAAVVWTVGLALCIDTVGPENLGKTIGSLFSFISVGSLAAPVLGGVLYRKAGSSGVFGLGGTILGLDLIMRLVVIEKKVAARYIGVSVDTESNTTGHRNQERGMEDGSAGDGDDVDESDESSPLLNKAIQEGMYKIPPDQPKLLQKVPMLYCFRDPSLVTALLVAFIQATLLGTFDATVPKFAADVFDFDALEAGLLFVPLCISDLALGPLAGWAVDRFGSRPVGMLAYGWMVPVLVAMRTIQHNSRDQLIAYCALLALSGMGLASIGAPSIVEAGAVVQRYHKANPDFFGKNGPYAQLYGMTNMVFCAGLTIGPLIFGELKDAIGYGNMNAVFAGICALTAFVCWSYLGRIPKAKS